MVLYGITLGYMMVFVLLVAMLGAAGNVIRRGVERSPVPLTWLFRSLGSRQGATFAASAILIAMHVEEASLPPTFRTPTLKGERFRAGRLRLAMRTWCKYGDAQNARSRQFAPSVFN